MELRVLPYLVDSKYVLHITVYSSMCEYTLRRALLSALIVPHQRYAAFPTMLSGFGRSIPSMKTTISAQFHLLGGRASTGLTRIYRLEEVGEGDTAESSEQFIADRFNEGEDFMDNCRAPISSPPPSRLILAILGEVRPPHRYHNELDGNIQTMRKLYNVVCTALLGATSTTRYRHVSGLRDVLSSTRHQL